MENKDYGGCYSEYGLWAHIKKYAKKAGYELVRNVLILYYALPQASWKDKTIIIGALGYFICPIDAIPDVLGPFGFTDDASVIALAVAKVRLSASSEVIAKAEEKCKEWFDSPC